MKGRRRAGRMRARTFVFDAEPITAVRGVPQEEAAPEVEVAYAPHAHVLTDDRPPAPHGLAEVAL